MNEDEKTLRRLLWLRHDPDHYNALYGDDGEMQCALCGIDFRRMTPHEIETALYRIQEIRTRQGEDRRKGDRRESDERIDPNRLNEVLESVEAALGLPALGDGYVRVLAEDLQFLMRAVEELCEINLAALMKQMEKTQ